MYTDKLLNNLVNLTIYSNKKSLVKRITTFSGVDSLLNARNYNIRIKILKLSTHVKKWIYIIDKEVENSIVIQSTLNLPSN